MSIVRFIGCLHLGHASAAKQRGFNNADEHTEAIVEGWNSVVNPKDTTYILGDVTMETNKYYHILSRLYGTKHVVMGNHDLPKHSRDLLSYVATLSGMVKYKGCFLTHAPINICSVGRCRLNIHAHTHDYIIDNPKFYNVDAHKIEYKPISLDQILLERCMETIGYEKLPEQEANELVNEYLKLIQ
jgi:calcineurin-like phosphoesterase family protein